MGTKVQHLKQYSPIPALLRAMREEANLSQRDLAALLDGKTQTYIQYCETKSRRVDLAEFIVWAKACQVAPEDALKRYMELAYPDVGKPPKRKASAAYPAGALPHLLAHEGSGKNHSPGAEPHAVLQTLIAHCMDVLDDAARERFMAMPLDAQKLELARMILEQLAQPKKTAKPPRKRKTQKP